MMESALISSPPIGTHRIQYNDEKRVLLVDDRVLTFSPTEYRLLKPLLKNSAVKDNDLVQEAYSCETTRGMLTNLDKHFDKIRSKLRPNGLNVYRIVGYGYILLPIPD